MPALNIWQGCAGRRGSSARSAAVALVKFGQRVVAPGSMIRTDGARQLRRSLEKDLVIPRDTDEE
ncbi:hypothetical protein LD110_14390 [Arthrobacter sp. M4]|nr:hypothetical protein [Arthrobacter sp. M4]MCA4134000.1 hypothetical protein [Arthrobacter sp. M4]